MTTEEKTFVKLFVNDQKKIVIFERDGWKDWKLCSAKKKNNNNNNKKKKYFLPDCTDNCCKLTCFCCCCSNSNGLNSAGFCDIGTIISWRSGWSGRAVGAVRRGYLVDCCGNTVTDCGGTAVVVVVCCVGFLLPLIWTFGTDSSLKKIKKKQILFFNYSNYIYTTIFLN